MPGKRHVTGFEWVKTRINELKKYADGLVEVNPDVVQDANYCTPIKLSFIHYFTKLYSKIISSRFANMCYVDLLAGCGINRVPIKYNKGKVKWEAFVVGSPIAAVIASHKNPFTQIYFAEKDEIKINVLKERAEKLPDEVFPNKNCVKYYNEDCNTVVDKIISEIAYKGPKNHCLVILDPYAFEVHWRTVNKILTMSFFQRDRQAIPIRCDIIFTFLQNAIQRTWGNIKTGKTSPKILDEFFGDNTWRRAGSSEELIELYMEKLKNTRLSNAPEKIVERIPIKYRAFEYSLILVTNKTKGGTEWLKAIHSIKKKIEELHGREIPVVFDQIYGRTTTLKEFTSLN